MDLPAPVKLAGCALRWPLQCSGLHPLTSVNVSRGGGGFSPQSSQLEHRCHRTRKKGLFAAVLHAW